MSTSLPAAPGMLALSPEQVGLGRKEGPSFHQPLLAHPISPSQRHSARPGGRESQAWPGPWQCPQSSHVAREPTAVCVGFHVSDFCFIPTLARALLEPYCPPWTALPCAALRPGCDPALPAPSPGTVAPPSRTVCHPGPFVPVSWKRPSVPVEQNARPPIAGSIRQKDQEPDPRPTSAAWVCARGRDGCLGRVVFVCVFLHVGN